MSTTSTRLISLFGASIFRPHQPTNLFPLPPLQFTPKTFPFPSLKLRSHYCILSSSALAAAAILDSHPTLTTDESSSSTETVVASAEPHHPWPEWVIFVDRLKTKGYFPDTKKENLDSSSDGTVYKDISILKDVCLSFARDRYDLLKSLSTDNMKTLIEKGCPNTLRKTVNSGKRLRAYVRLEEGDVCSSCNLRGSCDRAYVLLPDVEASARTIDVVRILLNFALDPIVGSGEMFAGRGRVELSARKLLSELTELSETIPDPELPPPVARVIQRKEKSLSFTEDESSRNVEMKRGDWMCPKCNFMNFSRNKHCLKCREDGPLTVGGSDYEVEVKGGDWVCSECQFMNFARNTQCLKCKSRAGKRAFSENIELKKGDWNCPQCEFMNFARNIKCLKCKGVKPRSLEVSNVEMKKGDWNCPDCHYMNFASNTMCKRCQGPRPEKQMNPGEWNCPSCKYLNFERNASCPKCNCERPKEVEESNYEAQLWKKPF